MPHIFFKAYNCYKTIQGCFFIIFTLNFRILLKLLLCEDEKYFVRLKWNINLNLVLPC